MEDATVLPGLVSNALISLRLKLFCSMPSESSQYPIFPFSAFLISTGHQFAPSLGICQRKFKLWFWLKSTAITLKMTYQFLPLPKIQEIKKKKAVHYREKVER